MAPPSVRRPGGRQACTTSTRSPAAAADRPPHRRSRFPLAVAGDDRDRGKQVTTPSVPSCTKWHSGLTPQSNCRLVAQHCDERRIRFLRQQVLEFRRADKTGRRRSLPPGAVFLRQHSRYNSNNAVGAFPTATTAPSSLWPNVGAAIDRVIPCCLAITRGSASAIRQWTWPPY